MDLPDRISREESLAIGKRRRGRNWLMLGVLVALVGLFYAMTLAKLGSGVFGPR